MLGEDMFFSGGIVSVEGGRHPWLSGRAVAGCGWLWVDADTIDPVPSHRRLVASFALGALFKPTGLIRVASVVPGWLELGVGPEVRVVAGRALVAITLDVVCRAVFELVGGWRLGGEVSGGWSDVITESYEGGLKSGFDAGARLYAGYGW
jgi:hypothetical protein